jgi:hypothetical protein
MTQGCCRDPGVEVTRLFYACSLLPVGVCMQVSVSVGLVMKCSILGIPIRTLNYLPPRHLSDLLIWKGGKMTLGS